MGRLSAILFSICCLLCSTLLGYAQEPPWIEYKGRVVDAKSSEPIGNAIVLLLYGESTSSEKLERIGFGSTDGEGRYRIDVSAKKRPNLLEVRLLGYKDKRISLGKANEEAVIYLEEDPEKLPEVVVLGTPITSKGDTITYRAGAFITNNTYSAEDLMKRLPGISVDTRGIISYLGEPVQGVYVEGLDLVADNYQTATRTIKAEDISAVEVMERFQKKRVLREIEEGEQAMINIRLKNRMLNPSGEAILGGGELGEQQGVHSLGANLLLVNKQTQILGAGIWDTSTVQEGTSVGARRGVPNSSARSFVGNDLTSHIDRSQALSQVEALGTLNQIFVLRENVTAKYNIGYGHKSTSNRKGNRGFLAGGEELVSFEEKYSSRIAGNIARASLNYTENSDRRYLLNTLTIEGDWEQGIHNIVRGEGIVEEAKNKELRVENNFDLVVKRGDDVSTLEAKVNYRRLPSAIAYVPSGKYEYAQRVFGNDLSAYSRFSYGWGLKGHYSIWGTVEIEGHLQDIGLTNGKQEEDRRVSGGKLLVSSAPTLSYHTSMLKWSISIPLQYNLLSYDYQGFDGQPSNTERGRLRAGVSAKVSYRPSALWYFSWNGRYRRNNLSEMTNYLLGVYYRAFDQIVSRSEVVEPERGTVSSHLNVEYRQPLQGLFGRLSVSAMRTEDNKIVTRALQGTTKISSQVEGKQVRNYVGGELYLSKQIPALKSVVSASTDYGYTSYPIIIGGQINNISSQGFGGKVDVSSTPLRWLELLASLSRRESLNSSGFGTYRLGEWEVKGGLVGSFLERWSAGVSGVYTSINEGGSSGRQAYTLLGANITYRHPRFRIELRGDNLLNMQTLYRYSAVDADRYSSYFALRPRQVMLSGYIKF